MEDLFANMVLQIKTGFLVAAIMAPISMITFTIIFKVRKHDWRKKHIGSSFDDFYNENIKNKGDK
jgi:hypothetical protein